MRWEALFSDLEAQLAGEDRLALDAEVAERVRIERATVVLVDRLRAHVGSVLGLETVPVLLRGVVHEGGGQCVVPVTALVSVAGLGRAVAPAPGASLRRLGLTAALRGLVRDRAEVRVVTDSSELRGTPAAVGADHLDLLLSPTGGHDRGQAVVRTVPLQALRVLRSR